MINVLSKRFQIGAGLMVGGGVVCLVDVFWALLGAYLAVLLGTALMVAGGALVAHSVFERCAR